MARGKDQLVAKGVNWLNVKQLDPRMLGRRDSAKFVRMGTPGDQLNEMRDRASKVIARLSLLR